MASWRQHHQNATGVIDAPKQLTIPCKVASPQSLPTFHQLQKKYSQTQHLSTIHRTPKPMPQKIQHPPTKKHLNDKQKHDSKYYCFINT